MTQPASAGPLETLRWEKRVLVVFAADAVAAARQLAALPARGLAERDMVVLVVPREGAVRIAGQSVDAVPSPDALRRHFRVTPEAPFVAVLVGKDGGEKTRQSEPVSAAALFGLIDAMPMRQQEARTK